MVASQLNMFLEHHHLLHNLQGAYRHGRSADQIFMYTVDTIYIVQTVDTGDCVSAAFLDLRKAFDSLDHCILLGRLQKLGVTGVELRWFTDYLSGLMQRVRPAKKRVWLRETTPLLVKCFPRLESLIDSLTCTIL